MFFTPLETYFKNEAAACKISRYLTMRIVGFAWSKVASVDVDASVLSQRVFKLSTATEGLNIYSTFLIPAKL